MTRAADQGRRAPLPTPQQHLDSVRAALAAFDAQLPVLERWGDRLAEHLAAGGRLLAAGNGGSAAEAQHLTAELVGRYRDDRRPLSAISLCSETSSLTAILNDYGADDVFERQVRAHGRAGDVLVLLSTSGRSPNVVRAAHAGRACGLRVWSLTGPGPNPLADASDETVCVEAATTATVQEVQLVAVHVLAAAVDRALPSYDTPQATADGAAEGQPAGSPDGASPAIDLRLREGVA